MNRYKFLLICGITWICAVHVCIAQAQSKISVESEIELTQKVIVLQDARAEDFYKKLNYLYIKTFFDDGIKVYSLQILNTSDRLLALDVKKDMEIVAPELQTELIFREPYYKVIVGILKNIEDAEMYREKVAAYYNYKRPIVIIPNIISATEYLNQFYNNTSEK